MNHDPLRHDGGNRPEDRNAETTFFGDKVVREEDKARLVGGIFSSVARRYDIMNDLMSGGVHRLWKNAMVEWLRVRHDMSVIDVGGGTGDIAFRILAKGARRVTVSDINPDMLAVGRNRAIDKGILKEVDWVCADAEQLPFPDASADAYTIAFAIRNVTRMDRALNEARRVLKPGGRFLCLEFSQVPNPVLERAYRAYSDTVLPAIGAVVTGDAPAYRYLVESIKRFPDQQAFAGRIEQAGLSQVRWRNLSGGIAAIHSAWRT